MHTEFMQIPEEFILKQHELGPLANFLYLVGDKNEGEIAIVDPAWDVPFLCQEAEKLGGKVTSIFLTHGHPDHVNGLDEILETYDVPVYISKHEAPFLKPQNKQIVEIEDGHKLQLGSLEIETILTPGHTPGCQCFKYKNVLIAGDCIFIDGCGRCDLPGGDARMQYKTLSGIIAKLPEDTIIYPGHNYGPTPFDTVGNQKKTNPYLAAQTEEEFLFERMGGF